MNPLQLLVLEDDLRTRTRLVDQLSADPQLQVAASVGSIADARTSLSEQVFDLLLFDLQLPDGDATTLIAEQHNRDSELPILVISVFGDEERVVAAIEAGARGYLLKDDAGDDICDSVRRAHIGESPISPAIARHLIRRFQPAKPEPDAESILSERELEVLRLASKGLTYQETAQALGVSVNTIGTYTRRVYQKLAVTSRAQAVFEARQIGIIGDNE